MAMKGFKVQVEAEKRDKVREYKERNFNYKEDMPTASVLLTNEGKKKIYSFVLVDKQMIRVKNPRNCLLRKERV